MYLNNKYDKDINKILYKYYENMFYYNCLKIYIYI